MTAHTPRTFEVPEALVAAGYGPTADLDTLDRAVEFPGEYGEWAEKVLFTENAKVLDDVCGNERLLPRGVLASVQLDDDSVLVSGLINSDGRIWDRQFNAWVTPEDDIDVINETIILDDDEVAFVARALREGADEVWFRPYLPKAFVSAVVAAPEGQPAPEEVPPGSAIIAVVDPIDEDAVLEMLCITPGPRTLRRHDGQWLEDPQWVSVLKSVKPPKIVKLDEAQVASVTTQVDQATAEQEWEPFDADTREQYQIFTASAGGELDEEVDDEYDDEEAEMASLVAVAGKELTPEDMANTERLRQYWLHGKGAAKIRWGTPGSWTRCYRNLSKYMGTRAKGYCTNLSERLGGQGIATHVGDESPVSAAIKRSPYLQELQNEDDERVLFALVAVAGRELTPKDKLATERLKRYWTVGKGAAKIRWGTPGSWRRCYRHLVKYVGPKIAPGYCTNLSQRLGGHGVATHVGMDAAITAANPSGRNGYSNGKSFEESTGGVERDYSGRFAPESGSTRSSNRSERAKRRKSSMDRRKKAREEKGTKGGKTTAQREKEKALREIAKAKNAAEREELAGIALQIAQLRADGKDLEAAELRVKYAQLAVQYADSPVQKINAQAALVNAIDALREKRNAIERKKQREAEAEEERRRRKRERDAAAARRQRGEDSRLSEATKDYEAGQ